MSSCRDKEADLLEFTQKLTDKNVCLQSEFTTLAGRAASLEEANKRLEENAREAVEGREEAMSRLGEEEEKRREEVQLMARRLAEVTRAAEVATQKVKISWRENDDEKYG